MPAKRRADMERGKSRAWSVSVLRFGAYRGYIGCILGLYRDNGKADGNYYKYNGVIEGL